MSKEIIHRLSLLGVGIVSNFLSTVQLLFLTTPTPYYSKEDTVTASNLDILLIDLTIAPIGWALYFILRYFISKKLTIVYSVILLLINAILFTCATTLNYRFISGAIINVSLASLITISIISLLLNIPNFLPRYNSFRSTFVGSIVIITLIATILSYKAFNYYSEYLIEHVSLLIIGIILILFTYVSYFIAENETDEEDKVLKISTIIYLAINFCTSFSSITLAMIVIEASISDNYTTLLYLISIVIGVSMLLVIDAKIISHNIIMILSLIFLAIGFPLICLSNDDLYDNIGSVFLLLGIVFFSSIQIAIIPNISSGIYKHNILVYNLIINFVATYLFHILLPIILTYSYTQIMAFGFVATIITILFSVIFLAYYWKEIDEVDLTPIKYQHDVVVTYPNNQNEYNTLLK